jgi:hypothetical protein
MKRSDQLEKGEEYAPLTLHISKELNNQFLKSLDVEKDERYEKIVHPGLIFNFCSITQSPSFYLENDIAAVGAKFNSSFVRPAIVDEKIQILWKVKEVYERRSRLYQNCEVKVEASPGDVILRRNIVNTFIGGEYLARRVAWEKETGYRRALNTSDFPSQGYEIVGRERSLTIEKMRFFSGGIPGLGWPLRNIHTDREVSIRSGIGKPVASGMMFESYIIELLICFLGDAWFDGGKSQVIAIEMAGDGDKAVPKAAIHPDSTFIKKGDLRMDLWCDNQYRNKIMLGNASCSFNQC